VTLFNQAHWAHERDGKHQQVHGVRGLSEINGTGRGQSDLGELNRVTNDGVDPANT
jgi:hypothetical protein